MTSSSSIIDIIAGRGETACTRFRRWTARGNSGWPTTCAVALRQLGSKLPATPAFLALIDFFLTTVLCSLVGNHRWCS